MSGMDIILHWLLPLLLYTGAVVPLSVALLLCRKSADRHRRCRKLLITLFCVQAASFLPFTVALVLGTPQAIKGLIWPALVGVLCFPVGLFYMASECLHRLNLRHGEPFAEPGAAPNGGPAAPSGTSQAGEGPPSVS